MTTLVIGATGFLGSELVRQGRSAGRATAAIFRSRPGNVPGVLWHHLDLRDPLQLDAVLDAVAPELVINASSGEADWATTADGPVRLAATTSASTPTTLAPGRATTSTSPARSSTANT
ncbi:NAD-dependent epimerase/dehydratase family protein [Streptomyces sp. SID2131]|nr:NAD-dependent epimerase/dehydratase family protein [Streptomyces sp. SID2131]